LKNDKVLSMVGLAMRAGKVLSGEFSVEKGIRSHQAYLVIVSNQASENTKKNFSDMCSYYKVPIFYYGSKEELGMAIGKPFRASIALTDSGFANAVMKQINMSKL